MRRLRAKMQDLQGKIAKYGSGEQKKNSPHLLTLKAKSTIIIVLIFSFKFITEVIKNEQSLQL